MIGQVNSTLKTIQASVFLGQFNIENFSNCYFLGQFYTDIMDNSPVIFDRCMYEKKILTFHCSMI